MALNTARARQLLAKGDLRSLFIEELGWDRHRATLEITIAGVPTTLDALAQKRGMVAYRYATPGGQSLPNYAQRRKIEQQVAKSAHEHLIVFTDSANDTQIWQWVKREAGKPAACRDHTFHRAQQGDALLQKLESIAFTLDEEERLSLTDVTRRARAGFDVERVTKCFYDRFQKEHTTFLKFISGITERADQEWYASLMLNRLMFVYFVQRKGFLDSDRDYLRNRLTRLREEHGHDQFYSFYRYFLLRLFHEGLGGRKRTSELEKLVGRIPYLNGGLFDIHELEMPDRYGKTIKIPDQAFQQIFDYFDQYQWHLDERPLRADNEINPDVLGYIFEKYINQKQMGAYYTKEDITEYISKNTVIPFLFDAARARYKVPFDNPEASTVWNLLKESPDRYIYASVRHGADLSYPSDVAAGLNPPSLRQPVGDGPLGTMQLRKDWNKSAPDEHALPTETWRDVITRRSRYEAIRAQLAAGELRDINDLITLNLDIRQFAQDVIENCEGPELLRAFWDAVEKVTILDPTCGSGAFLFAALNILEPLYEACLNRMEAFIEDFEPSNRKHRPEMFSDFRKVLDHVAAHPNRRYFIFKRIILNNLFGVDIMEEAVEICKLRLFLKLAAQVEPDMSAANLGIEPLPDIDFNIRTGNTLVGYATYDEVKHALTSKLDFDHASRRIETKAEELQQAVDAFRTRQTDGDGSVPTAHKQGLRNRQKALDKDLNFYLAGEHAVDPAKKDEYAQWLKSHQPFHWFAEFHRIMAGGGFDVIIGNPPYVELSKMKGAYQVRGLETLPTGNIYCPIMERSLKVANSSARFGMIVPLSFSCTERMTEMRKVAEERSSHMWVSHFSGDANPSKLFEGVKFRLDIVLARRGSNCQIFSSGYLKWFAEARPHLFSRISYVALAQSTRHLGLIPKTGSAIAAQIMTRILRQQPLGLELGTGEPIYVHRVITQFVKCFDFVPYFHNEQDGQKKSEDYKPFRFSCRRYGLVALAVLNSSTFFSYFVTLGDCFHCGKEYIETFPLNLAHMIRAVSDQLIVLGTSLMSDLRKHGVRRVAQSKVTGRVEYDEFWPRYSKPILDEIDTILAQHYGFTEEELDFIINYDIKYRMGAGTGDDEESTT